MYGELTVLRLSVVTSSGLKAKGRIFWECSCSCGKKAIVAGYRLRNGNTRSCGHIRVSGLLDRWAAVGRKSLFEIGEDDYYRAYKWSAKDRGFDFDLSREQFNKIVSMDCEYCGSRPESKSVKYRNSDRSGILRGVSPVFVGNGVDRVDSSFGYTEDNCVPCCSKCNIMKMALPLEDFKSHIKKISNHIDSFSFSLIDMCKDKSAVNEFISRAA